MPQATSMTYRLIRLRSLRFETLAQSIHLARRSLELRRAGLELSGPHLDDTPNVLGLLIESFSPPPDVGHARTSEPLVPSVRSRRKRRYGSGAARVHPSRAAHCSRSCSALRIDMASLSPCVATQPTIGGSPMRSSTETQGSGRRPLRGDAPEPRRAHWPSPPPCLGYAQGACQLRREDERSGPPAVGKHADPRHWAKGIARGKWRKSCSDDGERAMTAVLAMAAVLGDGGASAGWEVTQVAR